MDSKVVRAVFGIGLICPRAQTCMDSKVVRADFWQRTDSPPGSNMHGLKSGSCRFWQRTDLPPGSNMHGLKSGSCRFWHRTDLPSVSKVVRADFGSGLICPRAQTCCASPTQTPARLANSPGFKSVCCLRWRIKFSLERFSDPSHFNLRAQPLKNSAGRVPQAAD